MIRVLLAEMWLPNYLQEQQYLHQAKQVHIWKVNNLTLGHKDANLQTLCQGIQSFTGRKVSSRHPSCLLDQIWTCHSESIMSELDQIWTCHSEAIMYAVQSMKIIASGDARCDSPSHSASFGTYSITDKHSKQLITQKTVRVTEVHNSYWMEVECLKRCLNNLSDHGVEISSLATDRHPSVRKTMEEDYNEIRHEYDLWLIIMRSDMNMTCG